jgi:hypothetical protein
MFIFFNQAADSNSIKGFKKQLCQKTFGTSCFDSALTTLASQSVELLGQENKDPNVDNFLPVLHNNPSTFFKSFGLYLDFLRLHINIKILNERERASFIKSEKLCDGIYGLYESVKGE